MLPSRRPKVFCIGANKTGTTSMEAVFRSLGLKVGRQSTAEMYLHDWARRDYRPIIKYCRWSDAFQDVPFSYPGTYEALDKAFPRSKFVLTVRRSANEWFDSLVRFHTKIVGKGRIPTVDDLRKFQYRYPGFLWDVARLRYGADESTLYDRELYTRCYEEHNRDVRQYFRDRPDDFLEVNVAAEDAIERVVRFLGYEYCGQQMPHKNASR